MALIGKRGDKWHARICRKDHPTICKSFSLLKDAQTSAKNTELRMELGEALGRETVLLSTLLRHYLTSVSPLKKGHQQEVSRLNAWLKHPLASRDAASIKPAEIALYRDQRIKAGKANASSRIELSSVFGNCFALVSFRTKLEQLNQDYCQIMGGPLDLRLQTLVQHYLLSLQ